MKLNFMEVFSPFSVTGVHLDLRMDFEDVTGNRKAYELEFKKGESIDDVADGLYEVLALKWIQENIDSAYTIENIEKAKASTGAK